MKKKKKGGHHLLPSSRGGTDEDSNIKDLPKKYHVRWHALFGNLTIEEIHEYIDDVYATTDEFLNPDQWRERGEI